MARRRRAMKVLATLGPAGSNHELVARRYLAGQAWRVELVGAFDDAIAMLRDGRADRVLQCAAHPDFARTIGANRGRVYAVDCFISPSRELAVLTRAEVATPASIGLQPATASYVDLARWREAVHEPSIVAVAQGLLEARYDSGVTMLDLAVEHPGRLRVDERLGSVDDVWVVYGTRRACTGGILAGARRDGT